MKKKQTAKLELHRETIRNLNKEDLAGKAGAGWFGPTYTCPTLDCSIVCPTAVCP